jgi:hypothetical protein
MFAYSDLQSEAERLLWQRIEFGEVVDCRVRDHDRDDPAAGGSWGEERSVRAEYLLELLRMDRGPNGLRRRALRLTGVRITGALDAEAVTLSCPLVLRDCCFDAPLKLDEARAPSIRLVGSWVESISARGLETSGDLRLDRVTADDLNVDGARLGGGALTPGRQSRRQRGQGF